MPLVVLEATTEAATRGDLPLGDWVQYGVAGLVVLALIIGWLVPGHAYKREAERADRLAEENQRLRDHNETRVVPLLERALGVLDAQRRVTDDREG